MTNLLIKIDNTPVTVDFSKMIGLKKDRILWGDGAITTDTFSHTYNEDGIYNIVGNFDEVTEIEENFSIDNLLVIDLNSFSSLTTLKENFLNNCNKLQYLSLIDLNLLDIKNGFLNGCENISILKLPSYLINLEGWGENVSSNLEKLKIYVDHNYVNEYMNDEIWNDDEFNKDFIPLDYIYQKNINENFIKQNTFKNTIFTSNLINLDECTNIKNAIDNGDIFVENSLEEKVDPETRRVYNDEEELKKCDFILQYSYNFKENPNDPLTQEKKYIYTRLVHALNIIDNIIPATYKLTEDIDIDLSKTYYTRSDTKPYVYTEVENPVVEDIDNYYEIDTPEKTEKLLELEDLSDLVYYYIDDEELESNNIDSKYSIKDIIESYDESKVMKYDVDIKPYAEYEDPPYFRGWIRFGEINNENITNVLYNGDINTGFNIEIKAKGVCKNLYIYDYDVNEELGRREYLKINTDYLPEGKIISGDYILIKTSMGEKSAILERNGEIIDIMKYIDRSSSWLQIYTGDNRFYAKADSGPNDGSIYNLKINFIWNELYEGI